MAKKKRYSYKTIRKNGKRYMLCKNSNPDNKYFKDKICDQYEEVSEYTLSVLCNCCVRKITAPPEINKGYVSKGRIRGWQFMKEFVHTDGTVFHKGVEQPKLKGTLPPTPKPEPKKKLTKQEKEDLKNKLAQQMVFVRGELANAKWKKDERRHRIDLKKIERQLKKLN
jgi:hypothetical protein